MNSEPKWAELTIASGQTVSDALALTDFLVGNAKGNNENRHFTPKGILFPVTTGTAYTFQVSRDGGANYVQLRDAENAAITITKTALSGSAHPLMANDFVGWTHMKIVSGTTEAAERKIGISGYEV